MLFGTYQQLYIPENFETPLNPDRYYNEKLGFAPIWAVALNDYKDAIVSTINAAPNYPDLFYIIDTDDYIRINKIKYYEAMKNGTLQGKRVDKIDTHDYTPFFDNDCDDIHSEFLLNSDKISLHNIKAIIPVRGTDQPDGICYATEAIFEALFCNDKNVIRRFKECVLYHLDDVIRVDISHVEKTCRNNGFSDTYINEQINTVNGREVFEVLLLPALCKLFIAKEDIASSIFYSILHNQLKIMRLKNHITEWSKNDCSIAKYDNIVNEMKNYIIDDKKVLSYIESEKKIGPNEKCPCGSDKKFKKCHGRYL